MQKFAEFTPLVSQTIFYLKKKKKDSCLDDMCWMEKNELYVMGVFVIPKVEQVSDINFIYQELYPRNVNVNISRIFLHDSRLIFTTFSLCMCHVSGSSTSVFCVSLPGVCWVVLFLGFSFFCLHLERHKAAEQNSGERTASGVKYLTLLPRHNLLGPV